MSKEAVSIIGSSDGPTSVFMTGGKHKTNIKQKIQKKSFELRKKWYALWIKPNPHTMAEVAEYIREKYDFVELTKESPKYQQLYKELRSSFVMQYEPQLLGEYAALPELKNQNEEDIKVFLDAMRVRQEKASEVPEELFSLDYYYFEKQDRDLHIELQLEARFEYIGGSTSGKKLSKFNKIYKDVYKYYGVSDYDIKNQTKRYENLLRQLAMQH